MISHRIVGRPGLLTGAILLAGIIGGALAWNLGGGVSGDAPWETADRVDLIPPVKGTDGLLRQPWFLDSFLDLADDLKEATQEGKRFVILWEQSGCYFCRKVHEQNFGRPDINTYVSENFVVLQLNIWGSRLVTDFDGTAMEERLLAEKWGVRGTPNFMFLTDSPAGQEGQPGNQLEVARMPGYLKPFHFLTMFEFVKDKSYEKMSFRRYVQERVEALKREKTAAR